MKIANCSFLKHPKSVWSGWQVSASEEYSNNKDIASFRAVKIQIKSFVLCFKCDWNRFISRSYLHLVAILPRLSSSVFDKCTVWRNYWSSTLSVYLSVCVSAESTVRQRITLINIIVKSKYIPFDSPARSPVYLCHDRFTTIKRSHFIEPLLRLLLTGKAKTRIYIWRHGKHDNPPPFRAW